MRNKYHIGCLGVATDKYKTIRFVTDIIVNDFEEPVPKFEFNKKPIEFTSKEADKIMSNLLEHGWLAVTIRTTKDREYMCYNN